jgi:hypothetical protein
MAKGLVLLAIAGCFPPAPGPGAEGAGPLLTSVQAYTSGAGVNLVLQVTNTAEAPVDVEFRSGQSFDFAVLDGDRELWRWSRGQMFTQALRTERWAAGETRSYEAVWQPPPGLAGEFTVVGTLTASNHPVGQAARFRLP